ncbi:hypothetical protein TCAL_12705 [Tigriopus californicus]|uniref:ABC transporter domain-containing protein n=2 Tax=Tigriopus californicus TaxID=6832 RepID=A0A553NXS2_TIGCA|nr:hypothetical protein TCAL_12705 [Tigriopus californicus]
MDLYNGEFYGGVVFRPDFDYGPDGQVPDLHYTMRFEPEYSNLETNLVFPIFQLSGPGYAASSYDEIVKFQNLIDLAYMEIASKQPLLPNTTRDLCRLPFMPSEQIMPYPAYLENNVAIFLGFMLPMFTILSFCFIVPPLMKRIVHEKQTGVKELMKLMGLPSWMHWVSWFLNAIITSLITILIIVLLVCVEWKPDTGRVFDYSDPFMIFIFFLIYAMPLILMLFAISTFFDSPNLALATGVIVHVLTFIGPATSINDEVYMTMAFGSKMALAIMPNVGLWWGIKILTIEEGKGSGLQWNTLFDRPEPSDPMTMGVVWAMLLADMLIYGLIIWYVDAVLPGKYGVEKKWYFPFQKSYWFPSQNKGGSMDLGKNPPDNACDDMIEDEPQGDPGIRVSKLMKTFRSLTGAPFTAVNGVSFSAFTGQITALLGHNGAGKTTTMSVLTGMYSMTGGQATIFGCDIASQMDRIRQHLGLCPQHNMLFTDLNVREHLLFFGMLKGLSRREANLDAAKYIKFLNLEAKTNELSSNLSGGMKRKVNLGIALIGNSQVVMLDEPTSGMDPEARRGIWDLLQLEKRHRTILLTTHFMEEADVLGDRILIMSAGQIKCSGSPMFLKRRFGNGYSLTMSRGPKCNIAEAREFIRAHISEAELKGQASGELIFQLPDDQSSKFPQLFGALNDEKDRLGVLNFGLSVTTMEDVFLKVGQMSEYTEDSQEMVDIDLADDRDQATSSAKSLTTKPRLTGRSLRHRELGGLLKKRIIYTWRRKILYIIMMLIPSLYGLICQLVVNDTKTPLAKFKPREFDMSNYPEPIVFASGSKDIPEARALSTTFKSLVFSGAEIIEANNLTETILQGGQENIAEYRGRYILAADFKPMPEFYFGDDCSSLTAKILTLDSVYNSVPNHARPLAKNLLSNTLLTYLEQNSTPSHTITTGSHPLPLNLKWRFEILSQEFISPYVFAYGVALPQGMGVLIAAFVIFPLLERVSGAKQVQLMTGLHPAIFWLSNILWDFLLYIVGMIIMMAIIFGLDREQTFLAGEAAGVTLLLIGLFGLGSVPMAYVFSYTCESAASGFALLIILNVLSGAIGPTGVWILRFFGDYNDTRGLVIASDVIRYIFTLFPAFPMSRSIMALVQIQEKNNLCDIGIKTDTLTAW